MRLPEAAKTTGKGYRSYAELTQRRPTDSMTASGQLPDSGQRTEPQLPWKGAVQFGQILLHQSQRQGRGILADMLRRARFWDGDDASAAYRPGQRNRRWAHLAFLGDADQRRIAEKIAGSAQRRIRHDRQGMPLSPGEHVALDAAIRQVVAHLVGGAGVAAGDAEQVFHVRDPEIRHAPAPDAAFLAQAFKGVDHGAEVGHAFAPMQ